MKKRPVESRFGERYGHLVVLAEPVEVRVSPSGYRFAYVAVKCDCGVVKRTYIGRLTTGKVTSCGCQGSAKTSERLRLRNTTHGRSRSPIYKVWKGMVSRCTIKAATAYSNYGGRGITVCERWRSFENFLADMGERPEGMTLDRIDNDGPYSPENCRWVTHVEQCNNRRINVRVTVEGVADTLTRTCARHGLSRHKVYSIMKDRGVTHQEAVDLLLREARADEV